MLVAREPPTAPDVGRLCQPEGVHRPGPRADPAQPVAHRLGGDDLRLRAAASGSRPCARKAASAEECVQPDPWAAPSGWRSPGIATVCSRVDVEVGRLLAVAAGDHDRLAGRARGRARASASASPLSPPASATASGTFGVTTVARGSRSLDERRLGAGVEQRGAALGTITGSSTTGTPGSRSSASHDGRDRRGRAEHPDLHRVDADVARPRPGPGRRSPPAGSAARRRPRPCSAP